MLSRKTKILILLWKALFTLKWKRCTFWVFSLTSDTGFRSKISLEHPISTFKFPNKKVQGGCTHCSDSPAWGKYWRALTMSWKAISTYRIDRLYSTWAQQCKNLDSFFKLNYWKHWADHDITKWTERTERGGQRKF